MSYNSRMGEEGTKGSWVYLLLCVVALHAYLPVGWALGWITFGDGARYFMPVGGTRVVWYAALFWGFVHVFLVFPVSYWAVPEMRAKYPMSIRLLFLAGFFAVPLLSFAHYLGVLKAGVDYFEAALVVIPAAALAALAFERFGDRMLVSLVLTLTVFPSFFVLNDVLGPFAVYWNYAPDGAAFYWLRAACAPLSIGLAVGWLFRRAPESYDERIEGLRSQLVWLGLIAAVVSLAALPTSTASWLWLWPCWFFLKEPRRPRALVAAGLGLVVIPLVVALRLPHAEPGVASFSAFTIDLLVFGTLLSVFTAVVGRTHLAGVGETGGA